MTRDEIRPAGTLDLGGDLTVGRLGFGAMRLCGPGVWGEPEDPEEAERVLRRAVELGVNFIDTADAYGPEVSERGVSSAPTPRTSSSPRRAATPGRGPAAGGPTAAPSTCARRASEASVASSSTA